ncbi:MAG: hypothetical protein PUG37_06435, partial [Bacillales bacterium]|nr:hypothetical protein [Bacillales bacterium]
YDAIKCIGENEDTIKEYIQLQTKEIVKLDNSKTYFDGTNIYFEIDRENDELLTEQNIKNIFKAVPQHTTKILN